MTSSLDLNSFRELSPLGYYIAIRIGFAFPIEEINELPSEWIKTYTSQHYVLFDPAIRWVYGNNGQKRWKDIDLPDPRGVFASAAKHGLHYGCVVSCTDDESSGLRSFGSFVRGDRDFTDEELLKLHECVRKRHIEMAPPANVTQAELEALARVRDGARLKEIAYELGVSEGAVKQRLKNAKKKLNAKTGSQAAALAAQYGLI